MRLRIIISVVLMSWGAFAFAQGVSFTKLDNLNIPDGSLNMIRTFEGNYVSTGYWDNDSWLMKLNSCGGIIWTKQYNRGLSRSFSFDVVERPTTNLLTVQQIDTLLPIIDTSVTYRLPTARLVETDPCGTVIDEAIVQIPAGNTFGLNLSCPAAPFAVDNTTQDGLVVTGQTIYWEVTDTMPLTGSTRKTAYLTVFDFSLNQIDYTVFPEFPIEDTLVGYDVLSLPNSQGYLMSGAYFDASKDSLYLMTLRADINLDLVWSTNWAAAPRTFLPTTGGVNLNQYHAATSITLGDNGRIFVGGSQYIDTILSGFPVQTITAGIYELDPQTGHILNRRLFPSIQNPISLGLKIQTFDDGLLLAGSVLKLGGAAPSSAVFQTDWNLQNSSLYAYTDGSNFNYLATSVVSYDGQPGSAHALAGVRYLPNASDSTSSIIFFNSGAQDTLPVSQTYYGGPIVQIEEVNVLDTLFCSPTTAANGCVPFAVGIVEQLDLPAIEVFPNPVQDHLTIRLEAPFRKPMEVRLLDLQGREVRRMQLAAGESERSLDVTGLAPGIYVLDVGGIGRRKVVVR